MVSKLTFCPLHFITVLLVRDLMVVQSISIIMELLSLIPISANPKPMKVEQYISAV